jgi:hypothetical protein
MLTAERLREVLAYDPETGVFTRRTTGRVAGGSDGHGYLAARVDGQTYRLHRLAWLHTYGVWPHIVDHVNMDKADNRIKNLRDTCKSGNAQNRRNARKDNKLGVLGVSRHGNKYTAKIAVRGYNKYLGLFDTPEQASAAYAAAKSALHTYPSSTT